MLYYKVVVKRNTLVLKVGMAHTEYQVHEAFIKVARRSATVYKVIMAPTEYRVHGSSKMKYVLQFIKLAQHSYIGIVLPCTCWFCECCYWHLRVFLLTQATIATRTYKHFHLHS